MSRPRADIDLDGFARDAAAVPPPRRRWRRFALPVLLLIGFLAVLAWSLGDLLLPRTEVTLVRPRLVEGAAATGAVAFQAAGWVEPEPFARHVVPLTAGTVAEILVQEADVVKRGDIVARLVADDAALELDQARAAAQLAEAARDRARTDLQFAKEAFDAAIELTERVAVAGAEVDGARAERQRLAEAARRTGAEVRVAEEELEVQRHLARSGAAGPRQVELALARTESARASEAVAAAAAARAVAVVSVAEARRTAAARELELRITDRRAVALAKADLAVAEARVAEAAAALAQATLRRARVDITSPWDGTVLERLTVPGATVGGQGLNHAAICSLYDPSRLRVRVDVAQEDVGKLALGQRASIRCEARSAQAYAGEVVRIVHRADIQKVTLQVHVKVSQPDALLRPEMLCQVQFAGTAVTPGGGGPGGAAGGRNHGASLLIPTRLLVAGDRVWVLDGAAPVARLRRVEAGRPNGEWVAVTDGLNASDKLIDDGREGLVDGAPVRLRESASR